MFTGFATDRDPPLSRPWWPRTPRASTLVRGALIALLLTTAAAVLYAEDSPPPRTHAAEGPAVAGSAGEGSAGEGSEVADAAGSCPAAGGATAPRPIPAGAVGLPVRLAEPAALAVLRPGDRVDLLAFPSHPRGADATRPDRASARDADPPEPVTIADAALVLAVSDVGDSALYLAVPPAAARRATGLPEGTRFSVIDRPG